MGSESWKADDVLTEIISICLAPDAEFGSRLSDWEKKHPIDIIEGGLLRFIPFIYRRIVDLKIEARDYNIMRGAYYKSWWYQTVFQKENVEFLESVGVGFPFFALLKGVALQNSVYGNDPRTRPCDDVDILVSPQERMKAVEYLFAQGFQLDSVYTLPYVMNFRKSAPFIKDKLSVDLNWGVYEYAKNPDYFLDLTFQEITINHKSFSILSDTDNLIHTFLHGSGWNSVPSTRWILDAALLILRGEIDWDKFTQRVIDNGWQTPMIEQIEYLEEFGVYIPGSAKKALVENGRDFMGKAMYTYQRQPSLIARRILRLLYSDFLTYTTVNNRKRSIWSYVTIESKILKSFIEEYLRAKRKAQ